MSESYPDEIAADPPPSGAPALPKEIWEKLTPAQQEAYEFRSLTCAKLDWLIRQTVAARHEHAKLLKRHNLMESIYKVLAALGLVLSVLIWLLGEKFKTVFGLGK